MEDTKKKMLASSAAQLETESAFDVLSRAQKRAAAGHPVINLGIGQPDFQTSAYIVEAAVKALRDGQHGYTPRPNRRAQGGGRGLLRPFFGLAVDPDSVLVPGEGHNGFAMMLLGEAGRESFTPTLDPDLSVHGGHSGARPCPTPCMRKRASLRR